MDLSNNNLRSIPQLLQIQQYANIVSLNLSSNRISFVARDTFGHMSKLKTLDLSNNSIKSLSDIEAGVLFTGNTKLQTLNLSGNALTDLGDGYDQILYSESLQHLDASRCSITHLQGAIVLQGLPKLLRLDLSQNALTRIDGLSSASLQLLDLSACNLQFLRYDTFERLPNLKEVRLAGNRHLTDQILRPASASVVRLDASHCSIRTNYASDLPESQAVRLKGNLLAELTAGAFRNNSKLETLDLSDNRIRHVHELAFVGATSLRLVDLSGNRIATLAPNTFSHSAYLHAVYAARNSFSVLPPLNSSSLLTLDLSGCHIGDVAENALLLLPSLHALNVSHNRLGRLTLARFGSPCLQILDVSYCRLTAVDGPGPPNVTRLRQLDLSGNKLVYLGWAALADSRLERIWLAENPWICDCQDQSFHELWRYLSAEPSKLRLEDRPRCQYPQNVTGEPWQEACRARWLGEPRKSKDLVVLVIIVTVLLVSGAVACVVAVKESWRVRQSQRATPEERERQRLNEGDDAETETSPDRGNDASRESMRKLTQLPSYDEALLLPKPKPSTTSSDEAAPSSKLRQTVIRLELSKKRQSATQTEESIDTLMREMAEQEAEENPDSARRPSFHEMQYANVKPLPVQCTEL